MGNAKKTLTNKHKIMKGWVSTCLGCTQFNLFKGV